MCPIDRLASSGLEVGAKILVRSESAFWLATSTDRSYLDFARFPQRWAPLGS